MCERSNDSTSLPEPTGPYDRVRLPPDRPAITRPSSPYQPQIHLLPIQK